MLQDLLDNSPYKVGEAFASLHRTHQQMLMNIVAEIIRVHAKQYAEGRFDARSQASAEWAAQVTLPDGNFPYI